MRYLLFPGRHILNTSFQEDYLWEILRLPLNKLTFLEGGFESDEKIEEIIFAVTSANQENSRYNPVPFYIRAIGLDRFASKYKDAINVGYRIVPIPHFNPTPKFAELLVKETTESLSDNLNLNPENTVVLSSTPAVFRQFKNLGYKILPAEYDSKKEKITEITPIEVVKKVVESGRDKWLENENIRKYFAKESLELWTDFPNIPEKLFWLWEDPLLTEEGDITETRNYSTYSVGMSNQALIDFKYNDIREAIVPGKIVDEGCADCALITKIAEDFPDSDIIGIDITGEFVARCLERQRAGEFGSTFVHIHQRNLIENIFEENSIDTTICNSTTHELWSYLDQETTLKKYLKMKYNQTRKGGRLIIRDVVGPDEKDKQIYMLLNKKDGSNEIPTKDRDKETLKSLSTHARFIVFAKDFLSAMRQEGKRDENNKIQYKEEVIDGKGYIVLSLKDATEFMSKKDYTDNWKSELNEEFSFWNFKEWKDKLEEAGFKIVENPNRPASTSRAYTNEWIVENRFRGKVDLFEMVDGELEKIDYPKTNMVLIGEKLTNI